MVEFRIIALSGFITIGSLCAVFWLTKQLAELLLDVLLKVIQWCLASLTATSHGHITGTISSQA